MLEQRIISALVLGVAAIVSTTAWSATAHACSPLPRTCTPPVRLFPSDEAPGDHVYFKTLVDAPGELSLRDADGQLIEAELRMIGGDRVFAPHVPVAPGRTLTLTYTTVCPAPVAWAPTLSPSKQTFTFKTYTDDSTAGQPPSIGLYEIGMRLPGTFNAQRFARVTYGSPASSAQLHLQDIFVKIDGAPHAFGGGLTASTPVWTSNVELGSICNLSEKNHIDTCGAVFTYAAGKHEVEIWSTIVGAGEQPHVKLSVELACSDPSSVTDAGASSVADAGASSAADTGAACVPEARPSPAQGTPVAREDTSAPSGNASDSDLTPDEESAPDAIVSPRNATHGCALASAGSGAHALLALGAFAVLLARRRRGR